MIYFRLTKSLCKRQTHWLGAVVGGDSLSVVGICFAVASVAVAVGSAEAAVAVEDTDPGATRPLNPWRFLRLVPSDRPRCCRAWWNRWHCHRSG